MSVYNFTPHDIHLYKDDADDEPYMSIPSRGSLRVASTPLADPPMQSVTIDDMDIPVVGAQQFAGVDEKSPGFEAFTKIKGVGNTVIVSMVTAQALIQDTGDVIEMPRHTPIFSPSTSPANVVRKDGRIVGTTALEFHGFYH